MPFLGDQAIFFFHMKNKSSTSNFCNFSFQIGCPTAVLIFSSWLLKSSQGAVWNLWLEKVIFSKKAHEPPEKKSLRVFIIQVSKENVKIWIKSLDSIHFDRPSYLEYKKKKLQNSPNKSKINKDQNSKAKIRYNASQTMFNGKCITQCCYLHIKLEKLMLK